jgi:hypothetical protein
MDNNSVPSVVLNQTSVKRVGILLKRAEARGEGKSMDNFLEDLIDLACDVQTQRWENSDKARDRRQFAEAIASLNVISPDGSIKDPALLSKLAQKYHIVGGQSAQV